MRPLLAALSLAAALGLTACSDDGEPSGSPSPTESESVEESPTETPVSELPPAADACEVLDPAAVGQVLGVEVERVVAEGGCRFASPDNPETASLGISQSELAAIGGIDGAKAGIGTVVEGEVEDLPGVGDAAFVVVGPTFGGATPTGGGAVALGSSLVQITVIPGPGATEDDVRTTTVGALTLIAEQAGRG
jgi:hypothetical protein